MHKQKRNFQQETVEIQALLEELRQSKWQILNQESGLLNSLDYFEIKTVVVNTDVLDWIEYDGQDQQIAVSNILTAYKKNKRLDIRFNHWLKKSGIQFDEFSKDSYIVHFGSFQPEQIKIQLSIFFA